MRMHACGRTVSQGSVLILVVILLSIATGWVLLVQRQSMLMAQLVHKTEDHARTFYLADALFSYAVVLCKHAEGTVFHKKFTSRSLYEGPWPIMRSSSSTGVHAAYKGVITAKRQGAGAVLVTAVLWQGTVKRATITGTVRSMTDGSLAVNDWACVGL